LRALINLEAMMTRWLKSSVTLGFLTGVGLVSACSSSSSKPFPDVATFCVAKAKEECQIAPTCAVDMAGCQTVRAAKCNADATAATAGGTRSYNADNAQSCIDAVHGLFGGGSNKVLLKDLTDDGSMGDKCERVFEGTSDKNKPCASNYDCISGRLCSPVSPGSASRVCADKVSKKSGDFCADPGSSCEAGFYCAAPTSGAAQCVAEAQTGQPCSATIPCGESLRCQAGTCGARQGPGQTCSSNGDCSPTAGYCDPYAGSICTVGLTFATGAADCKGFAAGTVPTNDAGGAADSGVTSDAASDAPTE
jgi:hypothetical protein